MASGILGQLLLLIKTKGDTSGLDKTNRAMKKTSSSLKKMSSDMGILSGLSKKLMGGLSIGGLTYGFNRYLEFEKDLGAIHSRFFAITKDEQKAVEEFNYIRKIAKETANDIKATADSYSIFYSSTSKTLGKEGAREVFEDWTKVGRVLHLSEFQMERVTYALREMASKGAIYSQDLRMQIGTHVPNAMGLAQKAAEEMGFTGTDWFEKLQKAAKGNMQITTQFVRLFSKYAKQEFGSPEALKKALQQPDSLAQMLKNLRTEFGIKVSESGGKDFVINVLRGIYNTLEKMPLDAIATMLGKILSGIGEIAKLLPELIAILKDIAIIYIGNMMFKWFGKLGTWFNKLGIVTNLKYLFKGGLKAGFINILKGSANMFRYIIGKAVQVGILGVLGRIGARFIPFVGQVLLIVDILRLIGRIIRGIYNRIGGKDFYTAYGVTPEQVSNILRAVAKDNPRALIDPIELQKQIAYYKGGEEISKIAYIDNGNIYFQFKDTTISSEDIAKEAGEKIDNKKKQINEKYFNKPLTKEEQAIKNLRGW